MKECIYIVIISIFLHGCNENCDEVNTNDINGLWSLEVMEQKDINTGEWREWRNGMQGYLLYDDNDNMALHLTTEGYEETDLRFPNFTDTLSIDALKHSTNSYVYFAKYKVDKENNIVEHSRISHSNPGDWNKVVRRGFELNKDTLIIRPLEDSNSGLRLTWIRY